MKHLLLIIFLFGSFNLISQNTKTVNVNIKEGDHNIWTTKSCFSNDLRYFRKNTSKINTQWVYEDEQFFGDDGCYTLITRGRPKEIDIISHLTSITSLIEKQINISYEKN